MVKKHIWMRWSDIYKLLATWSIKIKWWNRPSVIFDTEFYGCSYTYYFVCSIAICVCGLYILLSPSSVNRTEPAGLPSHCLLLFQHVLLHLQDWHQCHRCAKSLAQRCGCGQSLLLHCVLWCPLLDSNIPGQNVLPSKNGDTRHVQTAVYFMTLMFIIMQTHKKLMCS